MPKKPKPLTEMTNYYKFTKQEKVYNPGYKSHLIDLPFRMLVIGSSSGGKGIFLCELLDRMSGTFEEIMICLRSRHEPLYDMLDEKSGHSIQFFESKIPNLDDYKKGTQRLIIFDDLILDKKLQPAISEYFMRARKNDVSCVYIGQKFFNIPLFIRQQSQYIVLKKTGSDRDTKRILEEYGASDKNIISTLLKLHKCATKDELGFIMIDKKNSNYEYRYCFEPINVES